MATRLNQIIAIEKGTKARVYGQFTELHKAGQKPDLFAGLSRNYRKADDAEESLPPERKRVQYVASEMLRQWERLHGELMEVVARKDWTNCVAKADVMVDGIVICFGAPVSFLLFLEKQMNDLRTFAAALPILDEGEVWTKDANSGLYMTEKTETHRTKKISEPIVLYPATKEHPAQTQMGSKDVIAGYWEQVKQSGALPKTHKQRLLERLDKVIKAIKQAREAANMQEEEEAPEVAPAIYGFLLDNLESD